MVGVILGRVGVACYFFFLSFPFGLIFTVVVSGIFTKTEY